MSVLTGAKCIAIKNALSFKDYGMILWKILWEKIASVCIMDCNGP